jgi:tetratricopeptide (TPR) repeat protein
MRRFAVPRQFVAALALCGALTAPSLATAQVTPGSRVLVMPFVAEVEPGAPGGSGASLWLGEAASVVIAEALTAQGVGALTRDERVAAFERLNLTMSAALTRATMIRVGELIGASEIVFGEVRLGTSLLVSARLIRLAAAREMPMVEDRAPLADIFSAFGRVAARLSTYTGRFRPTAAPVQPLPLETFESYIKGLVAATPAAQQRFLESALRQAPTDARILLALWNVHTAQDQHERALASASAVRDGAVAYQQARFAVALSLVGLRRFEGAFQALTALSNVERSAAISNALGVVQLRRGVLSGGAAATVFFKRAVDADPENPDYLFNLGYAYALTQETAEALVWLREAVRFDAADADAHWAMSAALVAAGRNTEAQREFELARLLGVDREMSATAPSARLPAALERLPMVVDLPAAAQLRTAVGNPAQRDQEQTAAFHLANGRTLLSTQRDREAAHELRRAIYLAPYQDEPHLLLGQIYQRAGRLAEAIDEFTVAIWCRETSAARLALAAALLAAGERVEARRHLDRALVLSPTSPEGLALLRRFSD